MGYWSLLADASLARDLPYLELTITAIRPDLSLG